MKPSEPSWLNPRSLLIALAALTCIVYSNSLLNGFTIDDEFVFSDNHFVRHLSNLSHLFDRSYFQYSNEASYRPVCTLTYFLDAALWHDWTMGPHLTNLVMYVGVVWLLFGCFRSITQNQLAAFCGAALFAVHPVHTEVVNNISFREDLLITLLLPASWLLYERAQRGHAWLWIPLAWLCYFLATLAKEMAVMFPLLALLLELKEADANVKSLLDIRRLIFLAGLIACTVLFVEIRFHWMQFSGEAHQPPLGGSIINTLLSTTKIQAYYLLLFFFPYQLHALYPSWMYSPEWDTTFFFAVAGLAILLAFVVYFRRARFFVFGVLWWFLSLAPVSNLYPLFNPMAERYLLLPSVGFCLWIGWLIARGLETKGRAFVIGAASLAGIALAAMTFLRNPLWKDNLTLWRSTAAVDPGNPRVLANLATAYYQVGDYRQAIDYARLALRLRDAQHERLDPGPIYLCLGSAYFRLRDFDLAMEHMKRAERNIPMRFDLDFATYRNLGLIYDEQQDLHAALQNYRRAAEIDPFRAEVWRKIAFCELRLGDRAQAEQDWQKARNLDRTVPTFDEAESLYKKSVQEPLPNREWH